MYDDDYVQKIKHSYAFSTFIVHAGTILWFMSYACNQFGCTLNINVLLRNFLYTFVVNTVVISVYAFILGRR